MFPEGNACPVWSSKGWVGLEAGATAFPRSSVPTWPRSEFALSSHLFIITQTEWTFLNTDLLGRIKIPTSLLVCEGLRNQGCAFLGPNSPFLSPINEVVAALPLLPTRACVSAALRGHDSKSLWGLFMIKSAMQTDNIIILHY